MKCNATIKTGYKFSNMQDEESDCGGEMEEKGIVVTAVEAEFGMTLNVPRSRIYQCRSCKTIQII